MIAFFSFLLFSFDFGFVNENEWKIKTKGNQNE